VFDVGETVIDVPLPIAVPPQEPKYHFQAASEPSFPPCTLSIELLPGQTVSRLAVTPVGSTESESTFRTAGMEVTVPALLDTRHEYAPAFACETAAIVRRLSTAPAIMESFLVHLKVIGEAPDAEARKVTGCPAHAD
jgi:hypothetical protein